MPETLDKQCTTSVKISELDYNDKVRNVFHTKRGKSWRSTQINIPPKPNGLGG